jgi:anti-sigma factor RsiW
MSAAPHEPGRCRDLILQISEHIDGDLSPNRAAALERHLAECVCCMELADSLRRAVAVCRASGEPRLPDDVRARAQARIAELLRGNPSPGDRGDRGRSGSI